MVLSLVWAAPAAAEPDASSAAATESLTATASVAPVVPRFGAMADVGLPDGATVSLVVRPWRPLRVYGGVSHNTISLGGRAGVSWVPLASWVSPTLSLEYGHYTEGNANPIVRAVSGDQSFSSAVLDRVGYDYVNAHVGLELGRKWFTFYLHAGVSRISGTVHNIEAETMSDSTGTTDVTFSRDPSVRVWAPSARLGFIVYLAK